MVSINMVKNCQSDSHLKSAQIHLSNIELLGLLLVALRGTLHIFLLARWYFEFCTVSKKPRVNLQGKNKNLPKAQL